MPSSTLHTCFPVYDTQSGVLKMNIVKGCYELLMRHMVYMSKFLDMKHKNAFLIQTISLFVLVVQIYALI